ISSRSTRATVSLEAPLVFVGYGLKIPEKNLDELAGLDLIGKVVVYLAGSPADIPSALASNYQTAGERWKSLDAAGVAGVITIFNPASMDIPWSRISANRNEPSMDLAGSEFNETPGQQLGVAFNPASAEKLFANSGHTFAEIAEQLEKAGLEPAGVNGFYQPVHFIHLELGEVHGLEKTIDAGGFQAGFFELFDGIRLRFAKTFAAG